MQKLIKSLDKKVSARYSGTGTLYVHYNGKKIRISNHEPNDAMRRIRGTADLEIYTHDLVGKEINTKYDVLEKVADYLKLEIKGSTKAALTRFRNKEAKEAKALAKIIAKNKVETNAIQKKIAQYHSKIRSLTKGREKELKQIYSEAEKYGALGSNGGKRRKRTVSYFKKAFLNTFGIEATPGDVKLALNEN
jgi:hypothetical protein